MAVEKVFVFDNSGLPFVMYDFKEKVLIKEASLISGFLSAITNFSAEIFKKTSSHFVVDSGAKVITLFKNEKMIIAFIADESLLDLKNQIFDLMQFFIDNYDMRTEKVMEESYYDDFKRKLISIVFYLPIASDWIPYKIENIKIPLDFIEKYPIIEKFDGKKNVREITLQESIKPKELYEILNLAYYLKYISFLNMIESKDYVIGTRKLNETLNNQISYEALKKKFPKIKIMKLVQEINDIVRIHSLEHEFGDSIIDVIEEFYRLQLVELVNEEFRKILITLDIILDFTRIIQRLMKKKNIVPYLQKIMEELDSPEIYKRLNFIKDTIQIDKTEIIGHIRDKTEIHANIEIWMTFIEKVLEEFYSKISKELNQALYKRLTEHYMNNIHADEMLILEKILLKLEKSF